MGFVKFDIMGINNASCYDLESEIHSVAQVAMMASREVLIAGGYVNKVSLRRTSCPSSQDPKEECYSANEMSKFVTASRNSLHTAAREE